MICPNPKCKQPNTPERNYCGACAQRLAHYCTLCGFRNLASHRFCGGCGAALGAAEGHAGARMAAPGQAAAPAAAAGNAELAELLEAAAQGPEAEVEDGEVRVGQSDIDSLFGE